MPPQVQEVAQDRQHQSQSGPLGAPQGAAYWRAKRGDSAGYAAAPQEEEWRGCGQVGTDVYCGAWSLRMLRR
jgi:hypothetical protein